MVFYKQFVFPYFLLFHIYKLILSYSRLIYPSAHSRIKQPPIIPEISSRNLCILIGPWVSHDRRSSFSQQESVTPQHSSPARLSSHASHYNSHCTGPRAVRGVDRPIDRWRARRCSLSALTAQHQRYSSVFQFSSIQNAMQNLLKQVYLSILNIEI